MFRIIGLYMLIRTLSHTQIQFWGKDEIKEKQFQCSRSFDFYR